MNLKEYHGKVFPNSTASRVKKSLCKPWEWDLMSLDVESVPYYRLLFIPFHQDLAGWNIGKMLVSTSTLDSGSV